jgi:hypothetical protein
MEYQDEYEGVDENEDSCQFTARSIGPLLSGLVSGLAMLEYILETAVQARCLSAD